MTFLLSLERFSQSRLQVYGKRQFVPRDQFFPFRAFSHDVMAAILVFRNNETIVMLEFYTNSVGMELFSYVNAFFCSIKFVLSWLWE